MTPDKGPEGPVAQRPEGADETRDVSHRCAICGETFPDYRPTWEHINHAHPEVGRGEITSKIIAPTIPAVPKTKPAAGTDVTPQRRAGGKAPAVILAHWSQLIEGLQTSSLGFYDQVEQALARREVPDTEGERVDYREAGLLSAKREYIRVSRGAQSVDICAAPFGTGFFVSWWIGEARPGPLVPTLATLGIVLIAFRFLGFVLGPLALIGGFFVVGALISQGEARWHAYVFAVPVVGWLWERLFRPLTLYRHDTMLMFKAAVHQAVLEVIDGLTKAQGLRTLSADERKPILRDFTRP